MLVQPIAMVHGPYKCNPGWILLGRSLFTQRVGAQERKQREKTTDKARKGKERSKETKDLSKSFIKGLRQDSDYQGEDYEVFSAWLGETE